MIRTEDILNGLISRVEKDKDQCSSNYLAYKNSGLTIEDLESRDFFTFITDFYKNVNGPPSLSYLEQRFQNNADVLILLDLLKGKIQLFGTDYLAILLDAKKSVDGKRFTIMLNEAMQIATTGKDFGVGKSKFHMQGLDAAKDYLSTSIRVFGGKSSKLYAELGDSVASVRAEYEETLRNPKQATGILTGIKEIDTATYGFKRGELVFVAAFVGEGKSTFAMNVALYASKVLRNNVMYASLEVPFPIMNRLLAGIHSSHPKFQERGLETLSSSLIERGQLNREQTEFYMDVLSDLENRDKTKERLVVWQPDRSVSINDILLEAEREDNEHGLDLLIIDYIGLVEGKTYNEYRADLNATIRKTKLAAMNFRKGTGIPILAPHQINRQGKLKADENGGVYDKSALADAHECERSADLIITAYLNDDLRATNQIKFGCLKARHTRPFEPFLARADFDLRKICSKRSAREFELA
jgi:replicative DNA helicase